VTAFATAQIRTGDKDFGLQDAITALEKAPGPADGVARVDLDLSELDSKLGKLHLEACPI
jgi:hypothetical protein